MVEIVGVHCRTISKCAAPWVYVFLEFASANVTRRHRSMRNRRLPVQPVEQPAQLARRDFQCRRIPRVARPAKSTFLKATIMKPETVRLPVKNFKFVAAATAKDKPVRTHRIELERLAHHQRQAVNRAAHVSGARRQIALSLRATPLPNPPKHPP